MEVRMKRRSLSILAIAFLAACSVNDVTSDGGPDSSTPDMGTMDTGGNDAGHDVNTNDVAEAGCMPCVVGTSNVGNCCVQ